jgi:hypothetical protein
MFETSKEWKEIFLSIGPGHRPREISRFAGEPDASLPLSSSKPSAL